MQYELINFSDPYTFIAPDLEVAALVVFSLSTMYGAQPEQPGEEVGIFMFGGGKEWYSGRFGRTPDEGYEARKKELGEALQSFMYGHFEDRRRYQAALDAIDDAEKKKAFQATWQDGRSSMNDIGSSAHTLGGWIMKKIEEGDQNGHKTE